MSILLIADDFPPQVGGIQTYARELAAATAGVGERVVVVASAQEGAQEVDERLACPVVRVPTVGGYPVAAMNLAGGVQQAAGLVDEPPRAMVAIKWAPEGPAAILARRALGCPIVLIGHGGEFSHAGGNVVKWLTQRVVLRHAARCLAVSRYTAELFERAGVGCERVGVIYGGVRPERFEVEPERALQVREELGVGERPMLLSVARLVERKGHDTVLRALPEVLERAPEAVYVIAGEGPMREALEETVAGEGLAESVIFAGRVEDERLPALYAAADLFVMPGHEVRGKLAEGLGLAYLEAAAAGVASVATRFGGIPDAVADGETGVLVEPGDHEALAEAVAGLVTDPERRRRMGEAARERVVREFTWRRVAERFLAELERLDGEAG